jgi:hypothetical protein
MTGRFNLNLARRDRQTLLPIPLGGRTPDARYFAVGGYAAPTHTPRVGILERMADKYVVARGVLFHSVTECDRRWGMVFSVDQTKVQTGGPFSLLIMSDDEDRSPERVDGLSFDVRNPCVPGPAGGTGKGEGANTESRPIVVSVQYPVGGTVCAGSVVIYGNFSGADSSVGRVTVTNVGTSTVVHDNSSPYYNPQGFWASSASGLVAGHSYSAEAYGDINTSGPGGTFAVVSC